MYELHDKQMRLLQYYIIRLSVLFVNCIQIETDHILYYRYFVYFPFDV
jgi:hypothetical protein